MQIIYTIIKVRKESPCFLKHIWNMREGSFLKIDFQWN